jgi:hypothetical protein
MSGQQEESLVDRATTTRLTPAAQAASITVYEIRDTQ